MPINYMLYSIMHNIAEIAAEVKAKADKTQQGARAAEVAMQQAPLSIAALNIGDIKSLGSQAA